MLKLARVHASAQSFDRCVVLGILALPCFYGNGAIHSHARTRGLSMRTHLTAVWPNTNTKSEMLGEKITTYNMTESNMSLLDCEQCLSFPIVRKPKKNDQAVRTAGAERKEIIPRLIPFSFFP